MGTASAFDLCPERMTACYGKDLGFLDDLATPVAGDSDSVHTLRTDTSPLTGFVPKSKLRRIDHYSRMALLACGRAIKDADPSFFSRQRTGVILATGYGALSSTFSFLDSYLEKGDKLALPTHFSNSVHNAAAAHISICYNIQGPSLTVSQLDMSFFSALITAGAWLETEKTDAVLIGTADAYCEVLGYCIHGFLKSRESASYSFGEGAAFFLVTRETQTLPRYGYFDEITMGLSQNIKLPLDADIIFSPGSTDSCDSMNIPAGHGKNVLVRGHGISPTDSGMDAAVALGAQKKICCLKLGQNGVYGKMMITPGKGGNT